MILGYSYQAAIMFIGMFYWYCFIRILYTNNLQIIISLIAIGSGVGYLLSKPTQNIIITILVCFVIMFYAVIEHFETNGG